MKRLRIAILPAVILGAALAQPTSAQLPGTTYTSVFGVGTNVVWAWHFAEATCDGETYNLDGPGYPGLFLWTSCVGPRSVLYGDVVDMGAFALNSTLAFQWWAVSAGMSVSDLIYQATTGENEHRFQMLYENGSSVGSIDFTLTGVSLERVPVTVTPEPATAVLMLVGLACVAARRRRRSTSEDG